MKEAEERPTNDMKTFSKLVIFIGATILQFYALIQLVQGAYFHLVTFGIGSFVAAELSSPWNYKFYKTFYDGLFGGGGFGYYMKSPTLRYGVWAFVISLPLFIFIYERLRLYFVP